MTNMSLWLQRLCLLLTVAASCLSDFALCQSVVTDVTVMATTMTGNSPTVIAVDSNRTVYLGGRDRTSNNDFVMRFSSANRLLSSYNITRNNALDCQNLRIALDYSDRLWELCFDSDARSALVFLLPDAVFNYTFSFDSNALPSFFAFDPVGDLFVGSSNLVIKQSSASGRQMWNLSLPSITDGRYFATDRFGNLFVNYQRYELFKLDGLTGEVILSFPLRGNSVRAMAVDSRSCVYISVTNSAPVDKYYPDGQNFGSYGTGLTSACSALTAQYNLLYCLSSELKYVAIVNTDSPSFTQRVGPVVSAPRDVKYQYVYTGNVGSQLLICDTGNRRVFVTDINGNPMAMFTSIYRNGSSANLFVSPTTAIFDAAGGVIIGDTARNMLVYFERIDSLGEVYKDGVVYQTLPPLIPTAMSLDKNNRLYVMQDGSNRIYTLDMNDRRAALSLLSLNESVRASGIAFDFVGNMFISDTNANVIYCYNQSAITMNNIVTYNRLIAYRPKSLTVRGVSYLYVTNDSHITQISLNAADDMIRPMGNELLAYRQSSFGMSVDPNGQLYTVNTNVVRLSFQPATINPAAPLCQVRIETGGVSAVYYQLLSLTTTEYVVAPSIKLRLCGSATNCFLPSPASDYAPMMCSSANLDRGVLLSSYAPTLWGGGPVWSFINGDASSGIQLNTLNGENYSCPAGTNGRTLSISFPCSATTSAPRLTYEDDCKYEVSWPTTASCPVNSRFASPQCWIGNHNFSQLSTANISTAVGSATNGDTLYALRMCGSVSGNGPCYNNVSTTCMACAVVPGFSPICLAYFSPSAMMEWSQPINLDGFRFRLANGDRCVDAV